MLAAEELILNQPASEVLSWLVPTRVELRHHTSERVFCGRMPIPRYPLVNRHSLSEQFSAEKTARPFPTLAAKSVSRRLNNLDANRGP